MKRKMFGVMVIVAITIISGLSMLSCEQQDSLLVFGSGNTPLTQLVLDKATEGIFPDSYLYKDWVLEFSPMILMNQKEEASMFNKGIEPGCWNIHPDFIIYNIDTIEFSIGFGSISNVSDTYSSKKDTIINGYPVTITTKAICGTNLKSTKENDWECTIQMSLTASILGNGTTVSASISGPCKDWDAMEAFLIDKLSDKLVDAIEAALKELGL